MPNFVISHFFQSFPTNVVQSNLECSILIISHFFQSFPTKVVYKIIQNTQIWSFWTFSNLFTPKLSKIIQNTQYWSFHTFPNLFPPKWSNVECLILVSSHFVPSFPTKVVKSFRMPNFGHFTLFLIFSDQSGMK